MFLRGDALLATNKTMKTYRVVKEVKAENMYEAIKVERNFHPKEIEEIDNDNPPMGLGVYELRK